jgi:hypothetical protein
MARKAGHRQTQQTGAVSAANVVDGAGDHLRRLLRLGARAIEDEQTFEGGKVAGDVAAGRLQRARHRQAVGVVFDEEQHW